MGMGGMSNKEQGPCTQSERSSRRSRKRERERGNKGGKQGEAGSFCIIWIAYWNKEGHVEGGTLEIPISVFVGERAAQSVTEQSCACAEVCVYACMHVCVCVCV